MEIIRNQKCEKHPNLAATSLCDRCTASLCPACSHGSVGYALCPKCHRSARFRKIFGLGAIPFFGAVILGLFVYQGELRGALAAILPQSYGKHAMAIMELKRALRNEACDRERTRELIGYLRFAGAYREAITKADEYLQHCGEFKDLHAEKFEAYKATSQWPQAIAEVDQLIKMSPYDPAPWGWRGVLHETLGNLPIAAADFQQTLAIQPTLTDVPLNLANVYERMNRPCDAIRSLEFLIHHNPGVRLQEDIRQRLERLRREKVCEIPGGKGKIVISFPPGSRSIEVDTIINGTSARLVLDTGASFVAITQQLAKRANIDVSRGTEILIGTANGVRKGTLTVAKEISINGLKLADVEVVIIDSLPGIGEGLLGMSFLSRFRMEIDQTHGRLVLSRTKSVE